jgi:hypothetical protein
VPEELSLGRERVPAFSEFQIGGVGLFVFAASSQLQSLAGQFARAARSLGPTCLFAMNATRSSTELSLYHVAKSAGSSDAVNSTRERRGRLVRALN